MHGVSRASLGRGGLSGLSVLRDDDCGRVCGGLQAAGVGVMGNLLADGREVAGLGNAEYLTCLGCR